MTPTEHDRFVEKLASHLKESLVADTTASTYEPVVSIIRTHISSVILAGNNAYKVKRPIKFPFLDFSSVDKRHAQCLRELNVNRRTAPEIYKNVIPITGSIEHPELNGTGAVIDWTVKMRRFEAGMLFSELAHKHALTLEHVSDLAQCIARFHLQQMPIEADYIAGQKPTQGWLLESLDEIEQFVKQHSIPPQVQASKRQNHHEVTVDQSKTLISQIDQLRTLASASWRSSEALRTQRIKDGWIRECHGDLHLKNITLIDDRAVMFDAIEFDDELRMIDVINEVAFTFMDLHAHGLPELSWQFLNEYQQQVGDYTGLKLLSYFTRYRAIIRAKVTLLSAERQSDQPQEPIDSNDSHDSPYQGHSDPHSSHPWESDGFKPYWSLALNPPMGLSPPHLFLVAGLSGSGKSTVASILSRKAGAVWLRADSERKRLFADAGTEVRYSSDASNKTYAQLSAQAKDLLGNGFNVVVDATFLEKKYIEPFERLCEEHQHPKQDDIMASSGSTVEMTFIVCQANPEVMAQRINDRQREGKDPSEATTDILDKQQKRFASAEPPWPQDAVVIVNDSTLVALEKKVLRVLNEIAPFKCSSS